MTDTSMRLGVEAAGNLYAQKIGDLLKTNISEFTQLKDWKASKNFTDYAAKVLENKGTISTKEVNELVAKYENAVIASQNAESLITETRQLGQSRPTIRMFTSAIESRTIDAGTSRSMASSASKLLKTGGAILEKLSNLPKKPGVAGAFIAGFILVATIGKEIQASDLPDADKKKLSDDLLKGVEDKGDLAEFKKILAKLDKADDILLDEVLTQLSGRGGSLEDIVTKLKAPFKD